MAMHGDTYVVSYYSVIYMISTRKIQKKNFKSNYNRIMGIADEEYTCCSGRVFL